MYAYAHAYTMTKVISLSEEAYKTLKDLKRRGESFSDVIMRMVKGAGSRPLLDFAGKWAGDDVNEVFEKVLLEREEAQSREL